MPENASPTTISDMSNSEAKDGMLNDVQIKRKRKAHRKPGGTTKSLRKTIFGPHS